MSAALTAQAFLAPAAAARNCAATPQAAGCADEAKAVGGDRVKEVLLKRLMKRNAAPVAAVEIGEILDRHVELDASGSRDDDGFVEHYTFQLLDADTGDVLAGPETVREPYIRLTAGRALPPNLLARVSIEDDLQATDSAEAGLSLGAVGSCENAAFSCSANSIYTNLRCTPKASVTSFTAADLLDATGSCEFVQVDSSTELQIFVAGAAGARGANFWPYKGGAGGLGGVAGLSTTIDKLEAQLEFPSARLCYFLGSSGGRSGANSGAGGASSYLSSCSGTALAEFVALIGGGGGGGGRALTKNGSPGGNGGLAFAVSGTGVSCGFNETTNTAENDCSPSFGTPLGGWGGDATTEGSGQGGGYGVGGGGLDCCLGQFGFGGKGGFALDWGQAGFYQGSSDSGDIMQEGTGGQQLDATFGGSGGGGTGGGGAGYVNLERFGGGGGGGSAATQSTEGTVTRPLNGSKGYLLFVFVTGG